MATADVHILIITGFARSYSLHVEPCLIFETGISMYEARAIRLDCRIWHLVNAYRDCSATSRNSEKQGRLCEEGLDAGTL